MFKATKSFRFIVVLIAIFAVSTLAIAANWSGARAFGFFESSDAATSVAPEAAPAPLSPQTVVLSDGFEGATTFLFANTAATNLWTIGAATNNGGSNGAYITNDAGVTNAYTLTTTSTNHLYAPITVPTGESAVVLSFDWKGIAEYDATTTDFDYLRVSVSTVAPVAGSFPAVADQLPVRYSGQDNYTKAYVTLPAAIADGAPRFLIFTWRNDSSLGFTPAAIDNVNVTSQIPAPLSGTKTIPGDYPSIGAAFANVNANGADTSGGSLIFNVAAGSTFIETPSPLTASGSDFTKRIIFQKSGAGANPLVTAEGSGNFGGPSTGSIASTSDAVIALNGADFVTFDGIDVASSSVQAISPFSNIEYGYLLRNNTILANVITINSAQNNIIQNTNVSLDRRKATSIGIMQSASTTTGAGSTAASSLQANSGNKYYNLTIQNANAGIYLLGTPAFPDDLTEVGTTSATTFNSIGTATANDIGSTSATTWGIRFASQSNAKVFNNEIRNLTGTSTGTVAGIHMDNAGTVTAVSLGTTQISNNIIHDLRNTVSTSSGVVYGIRANLTGNAGSISKIQNNFIYGLDSSSTVTTSVRLFGIQVQDAGVGTGATHNVHNNSVRIAMPSLGTISTCFGHGGGSATNPVYNVRNNIFANVTGAQAGAAKHYAWVSTSNTTIGLAAGTVSDFNDLYVTGTNGFVGRGSTIDYATITDWRGMDVGAGPDDGSISADPLFASATDLHLTGASPAVNSVGATIATVTDDIDGQSRPQGAAYEIGADEFVPAPGILQLSSATYAGNEGTTLVATVNRVSGSSGIVGATYTLTDASGAVGGGACGVGVDYVNPGPQPLSFGDSVASQPINVTLCTDLVSDPAETFTITISAPSGGATLGSPTVATATIGNVDPPFSGAYNVGTGEAYTSLTNPGGIFENINLSGATGNITINITTDLTGELGTHALNEIAGGFTVLIKPSGAPRTITGSNTGALIRLNGADGVRIDGSTAAVPAAEPEVVGGNPALRELTIQNTNVGTSAVVINVGSGTNGAQNNTIKNVNILGQDPTTTLGGITMGGNTPGTVGTDNDNNRIENCTVKRSIYGIYSAGASLANQNTGTVITQNDLSATGADRIRRVGIVVFNDNGVQITENSVGGLDTNESADAIGIGIGTQGMDTTLTTAGGVTNALVARNKINGVASLSATGFSASGIAVAGATGGANTVQNNMISGVTAPSTAPDLVAGIYVVGAVGSSTRLYHNTVSLTGDRGVVAGQTPSFGVAITGTDPTVELKNNIFHTTQIASGGGVNAKSYAIGMVTTTFANLDSNYNDFWSAGANDGGFRSGSLTTAAGTDYATVALWAAAISDDANSIEADPAFVSATDLHLQPSPANPLLLNGGTNLPAVTNDIDNDTRDATPAMGADEIVAYTVGGTVSGLSGTGLVLQNNAGNDLAISANGAFTFTTGLAPGATYAVTVLTQPTGPSQTCTVTNGSGTIAAANVTNVTVNCVTNTYTVGGTVSGLAGSGLVLQNNAGDNLPVAANGSFTFATSVASGGSYAVTVFAQPTNPSQTCSVTSGSGTVTNANITNVSVTCTTNTYTVGGTVSGLNGTGLTLRNNGGDDLAIAADGAFTFATPVASGGSYAVTVFTQPSLTSPELAQTCTVTNGSGTVGGANVTNVSVACTTNNYTVGGTVSGLSGSGLVLQNNAGDNLPVAANGAFTFATPVASGGSYAVTVFAQPTNPSQTCSVTSGSGTVTNANITNVSVTCTTNTYTVGGTVSGLTGTGFVIQNNGGDNLPIAADGAFTFTTPVASGAAYAVTVLTQPTGPIQSCAVTNGSGTITNANVTNVTITCTTPAFVEFASATYREDESQTAQIRLVRTGNTSIVSTVEVSTTSGGGNPGTGGTCGTAGVDYGTITNQSVVFNSGDSEAFATVQICTGDTIVEIPDETASLSMSVVSGASAGTQTSAVLRINDTASQFLQAIPHDPINMFFATVANPYPSQIVVAGAPNIVGTMRVTLYDVSHANPDNMDVLLVGPLGQKYLLVADTGGPFPIDPTAPVTLTFSDFAGGHVLDSGAWTTGQFLPTVCESNTVFAPGAPALPYVTPNCSTPNTLAQTMFGSGGTGFGLTNPNGTWSLYVRDDAGQLRPIGDDTANFAVGRIAGGWGLEFLAPTAADVSIGGRVLTGEGRGIRGARVTVTGNSLASPITVTTGVNGRYTVPGLTAGETYVVTVSARRFFFEAPSRVITLNDNVTDADFTGSTGTSRDQ